MKTTFTKRKRLIIGVGILLVVVGVIFFWASSGNQGTISQASTGKRTGVPAYKQFESSYVSFQYKGTYQPQKLEAKGQDLELYMLRATTLYSKQLAVNISQSPTGRASEDSGYILRQSQSSVYTKHDIAVAGEPATLWTKNDNSEQTVFMTHNGKIAVLSFNTAGNDDNLQPEVDALLATFRWKQ